MGDNEINDIEIFYKIVYVPFQEKVGRNKMLQKS